ncbi:hypothetical protein PVAND_006289 [Polypedilum vanderplanki]|uniref:Protein sleepless n=1 Tax=Polypedilum vanderplanki TaxID=319348 RepID=A0A9J6C367_POLVA|nr:hypothetical protein PVAND_006289 [Polypedilum vanderplanki]
MDKSKFILIVAITLMFIDSSFAIWCYRCNSATPGCSDNFNWRGIGYLGEPCPEDNDICVKITERKGASEFITRECLSALVPYRTDIPADKYEGCRPGTYDPKLANYVNNSIKEINVHRDYFDSTTWCFCFLDHRCNSSTSLSISILLLTLGTLLALLRK